MPHEIHVAGRRFPLHEVIDLGAAGHLPLLRVQRTAAGDTIAMANSDLMRDGLPLAGNLTVVAWGASAVLRVGQMRVEILWQAGCEDRPALPGERCRLCCGAFDGGETAIACSCEAIFHRDCESVRLTCPACGAPRVAR